MHAMQTGHYQNAPKFNGLQIKPSIMGPFEFLKIGTFRTFVRRNISLHMLKSHYALSMQLFQQALISIISSMTIPA